RRVPAGERGVDQRLVLRAGRVLGGAAPRPDGFADDPYRGVRVLGGEGEQHGRDDPAGVAPGDAHVMQGDPGRVGAQRVPDEFQVPARYGHHHRLARGQPGPDEGDRAGQVLRPVGIQQSRMDEAVGTRRFGERYVAGSTYRTPPETLITATI